MFHCLPIYPLFVAISEITINYLMRKKTKQKKHCLKIFKFEREIRTQPSHSFNISARVFSSE